MKRHRAECGSSPQERPEYRDTDGDHHDTDGDGEYHDTDVAPNVSPAPSTIQTGFVCPLDAPIVAHFNAQKDSPGLGQCIQWGPRILTPQEEETFCFLRVVDAGSGASGACRTGNAFVRPSPGGERPSTASDHTGLLGRCRQGN